MSPGRLNTTFACFHGTHIPPGPLAEESVVVVVVVAAAAVVAAAYTWGW